MQAGLAQALPVMLFPRSSVVYLCCTYLSHYEMGLDAAAASTEPVSGRVVPTACCHAILSCRATGRDRSAVPVPPKPLLPRMDGLVPAGTVPLLGLASLAIGRKRHFPGCISAAYSPLAGCARGGQDSASPVPPAPVDLWTASSSYTPPPGDATCSELYIYGDLLTGSSQRGICS